jgi:alpha-tubulin suppressor-like RCC1 family protein
MNRLVRNKNLYLQRVLLFIGLLLAVLIGTSFVRALHSAGPDIQGANYRLFNTSNSTAPGAPLAGTNTSAQLATAGQSFRLRTGLTTRPNSVDITMLDAGVTTSCAIVSGLVYCSGMNTRGELGNDNTDGVATSTFGPVSTNTGLAGKVATDLAIGPLNGASVNGSGVFVCAIADGLTYCWGSNSNNALGIDQAVGTTPAVYSPTATVMAGSLAGESMKQIDAGDGHVCGVTVSGKGVCWGSGGSGRLGDGTGASKLRPTEVAMTAELTGKTFTKMTAASATSCGIASGVAFCWGVGSTLGNGSTTNSISPVPVTTSPTGINKPLIDITSAISTTCVLDIDGNVFCWGTNNQGEAGNNAVGTALLTPVATDMSNVPAGGFKSIAAKQDHICGITAADSKLYCWGTNSDGSTLLGLSSGRTLKPTLATALGSMAGKAVTYNASGRGANCAIADNIGYCAGTNTYGALGLGTSPTPASPSPTTTLTPVLTTNFTPAQGITIAQNALSSRLEYAQKSAATCSVQTGFAPVTTTTPIAWSPNGSVASGSTIAANANDPFSGSTTTLESYVSAAADFTNPAAIISGNSGLWDFSLKDNSTVANRSYCLRLAQSNGTAYTAYTAYPEVKTAPGVLSLGFYDANNTALSSPVVSMPSTTVSTQCQQVTGTLSNSNRKLRVSNDSDVGSWGLGIAATNGPGSVWQHQTEASSYDFNDPSGAPAGCYAGSDGDIVAGQLTINPAAAGATITPKSGCSNNGVSFNAQGSFNQGVADTISIANASSSAQTLCYWDLTNIGLSQKIPPSQANGSYQIDLTMTVIAQ